ncbi:4-oxalocrotonate tautomerase [Nonomuraea basaltis]|nr:4-oxalocrotonate tautomerase [Nonomuraea basaltis]
MVIAHLQLRVGRLRPSHHVVRQLVRGRVRHLRQLRRTRVTLFHEVPRASFLVGGVPSDDTVRVVIEHIARHAEDSGLRERMSEALGRLLAAHTGDRGLHCEFHIDETPRDLWMIDGLCPPPTGSEAEQLWAQDNRPVPY